MSGALFALLFSDGRITSGALLDLQQQNYRILHGCGFWSSCASSEIAPRLRYLKSIEPGCTFIQTNYESRKQNREAEIEAMKKAIELLEGTPAFQAATAAADREALGKCGEDGQPSRRHGNRLGARFEVLGTQFCLPLVVLL